MLGEKHDLIHELPEYRERIHQLKTSDEHFARLFDAYHEIEHEVRKIEEGVETASDEYLQSLKLKRLQHKDDLYRMLTAEA